MRSPQVLDSVLRLAVILGTFLLSPGAAISGSSPSPLAGPHGEWPSLPESATARAVIEDDAPQLRARLLVSSGPERRVGVLIDLEPGWHVYWRNPGGTGIAPDLGLSAEGFRVGDLAWPSPETFEEADGLFTTWGYEGSVLLSAPLESLGPDGATIKGVLRSDANVLICRTQCVPAEFSLSLPIDMIPSAHEQAEIDQLFARSLASVPLAAETVGLGAQARWTGGSPAPDEPGTLELTLETCEAGGSDCPSLARTPGSALFVPMEGETFEYSPATVLEEDAGAGRFVLGIELTRLEAGEDRLRGLVPLHDASGRTHHVALDVAIGQSRAEAAPLAPIPVSRWAQIFLLALLGGLILNGMPCVLPVLAIKVVAIADMAEKDPREVRLHGLAYTAGVLGSMAALSIVVLSLRAAGHSVGWGFQFQEPLFVAGISAILVTFALNLFGVFEIELGQGRLATIGQESTGLSRSVFEGLLAVVLATPCTAPFLGTAVGFAFATSGLGIAAIFLAIGLGLASPFLIVSFLPRLARFIPRSGPWMNTLRAGLGFCLLATVVWLLWVLGQSGGVQAVVSMTGVLLFVAFLLWGFGQLQPIKSVWLGRAAAASIAGLAFIGFNLIEFDRAGDASPATTDAHLEAGWQTYSESAVRQSLSEGRPAFVVFTADWCITCQVNERTVLERAVVREALVRRNYSLFKADWTRRDDRIRQKLAEFGRAGVPLYLVYRPDRPDEPQVLSELLSKGEVLTALAATDGGRRI